MTVTQIADRRPSASWSDRAATLGARFAEQAASHDQAGTFVAANFEQLKSEGFISAAVSPQFGGGGASYSELCDTLRTLARHCPSTALSFSMHTHLTAASVFKLRGGAPEEALQRRIAKENLVLISTGAGDWIESSGTMTKVEGGYTVTARKVFASASPVGKVFITTSRYDDPKEGMQVLHFPVAASAEGVEILSDWDSLGMRGTGSNTVVFNDVFVPEEKVALRRADNAWHPSLQRGHRHCDAAHHVGLPWHRRSGARLSTRSCEGPRRTAD